MTCIRDEPMRTLSLALFGLLAAFTPRPDGTAHVAITGDVALAFDGYAYVTALDGFTVLALATAPLDGGRWAIDGDPFDYVELRLQAGLAPGTYALADGGGQGQLVVSRWDAAGDPGPTLFVDEGTLTLDAVRGDGVAEGTLTAALLGYGEDGAEHRAALTATFEAVPGMIPPP